MGCEPMFAIKRNHWLHMREILQLSQRKETRKATQYNAVRHLIRTEGSCPHLVSHLETEALTPVALVDPTPFSADCIS
jgi:hypothetical protein